MTTVRTLRRFEPQLEEPLMTESHYMLIPHLDKTIETAEIMLEHEAIAAYMKFLIKALKNVATEPGTEAAPSRPLTDTAPINGHGLGSVVGETIKYS